MPNASFQSLIQSETPVLLDFHAEWCGPCKAFAPTLDDLKQEMGDRVRIFKIDIDKNPALAKKLDILGVPTVMLYHKGELKWQASGGQTLHVLKKQIEALNTAA